VIIPPACLNYAKLQLTQLNTDADACNKISALEFNAISSYIKSPKHALDLGCGMGRMSAFINAKIGGNTHYILADVSKRSSKIKYGWNPGDVYYNNLNLTSEFVEANGLVNYQTLDISDNAEWSKLSDVDLVFSFLAVGFHYPIEKSLSSLLGITTDDCVFIFGVRRGKYSASNFSDIFRFRELVPGENNVVKEDYLIMSNSEL